MSQAAPLGIHFVRKISKVGHLRGTCSGTHDREDGKTNYPCIMQATNPQAVNNEPRALPMYCNH